MRTGRPASAALRAAHAAGRGFTLVELLAVVAIVAIVAGIAVILTGEICERTDRQAVLAELAGIRKAFLRFAADMGEPPRYLAELMQSPDPSDPLGGWWWRTDGTPAPRLRSYDPATRKGWNGPYVKAEAVSEAAQEAAEARLVAPATYERAESNAGSGKRLSILLSDCGTWPQKTDGTRLVSHYQLDYSDPEEIFVRFIADPLAPAGEARAIARLGLGVKP
ncbi:MAG: prepilin-type N-terminal cleavage/methylation domain-containing protein [Planctomycetota bacterium]|nr:prepilin-type N-terminal cleavage/methylation domain-containing protein [Planctomycetota bacterium]